MNAVDIEQAITDLIEQPFDAAEFSSTLSDFYKADAMLDGLREAQDRDAKVLKRLSEMYDKMTKRVRGLNA